MTDHRQQTANLDKVIARIKALREKTIDRGCTEQEAVAASKKVADILAQYELSMSDVDLESQSCQMGKFDTGRKRKTAGIDFLMRPLARFFDLRTWCTIGCGQTMKHIFFGLPADVEAALYLVDVINVAMTTETEKFKKHPLYCGASDLRSFQLGMALSIESKLNTIKAARTSQTSATGTDLVPVKSEMVNAEYDKLGLKTKPKKTNFSASQGALEAGAIAGQKFEITPGVGRRTVGEIS